MKTLDGGRISLLINAPLSGWVTFIPTQFPFACNNPYTVPATFAKKSINMLDKSSHLTHYE